MRTFSGGLPTKAWKNDFKINKMGKWRIFNEELGSRFLHLTHLIPWVSSPLTFVKSSRLNSNKKLSFFSYFRVFSFFFSFSVTPKEWSLAPWPLAGGRLSKKSCPNKFFLTLLQPSNHITSYFLILCEDFVW